MAIESQKMDLHGKSKIEQIIQNSPSPTFSHRPPHKERVKSAPILSHDTQLLEVGIQHTLSHHRDSSEPELETVVCSQAASLDDPISNTPARWSSGQSHVSNSGLLLQLGDFTDAGSQSGDACGLQEVVIALLSTAGVGKSTFIQCALDLKRAVDSPISSKKVSLEGSISVVRLVELDIDNVHVVDGSVRWPKCIGGQLTPPIDGALVLYSVMDQHSIAPLAPLLSESTRFPHHWRSKIAACVPLLQRTVLGRI